LLHEKKYRMFLLDFGEFQHKEIKFEALLNTEIIQKEPNFLLFDYKTIVSVIFFVFSVLNLFLYALKIYKLEYKQIGFLRRFIYVNLMCCVLYNFIYSFENQGSWLSNFLDSFINSLMYALIFFLNLVLIDAQTDKIHTNLGRPDSKTG
jgi:hypothetical protein